MYNYRNMTPEEREEIVAYRRERHFPWHSPPHWDAGFSDRYLVTAACYEHAPIIGQNHKRMAECEEGVLATCREFCKAIFAWCVLPNHYHVVIETAGMDRLAVELGKFHGRSSHAWNGEDDCRGRKVWFRCFDRQIRSLRHFWASVNYVHHNPVHHGYVDKWSGWPWSSASEFLEKFGREKAEKIWREHPLLDYGKGWDI
jgi:putative transposase